jgi:hypothetical protein
MKSGSNIHLLLFCCLFSAAVHGGESGVTVTARAGPHGTITPERVTVAAGQSASFTIVPEQGYAAMVSGCGGRVSGNTYTTAPVRRKCRVNATFLRVMPPNKEM